MPAEPDSTAPDTALALQLWRNGRDGERIVRAVLLYQTLTELRAEAMRASVDTQGEAVRALPVTFPGCAPQVVRIAWSARVSRAG